MTTPAEQLAAAKAARPHKRKAIAATSPVSQCRLYNLRKGLGLTLAEVAGGCGLTIGTVHRTEAGRDPMLSTALKLARFYGKSVEDLWTDFQEQTNEQKDP